MEKYAFISDLNDYFCEKYANEVYDEQYYFHSRVHAVKHGITRKELSEGYIF